MSASITIGSLALAANGKTLTATLSGGTGTGYAPSSAVTGLLIHLVADSSRQFYLWVGSTAISGSTLTINLLTPAPSGGTVTVDLDSGSNLTDSGSNTATGQTGVSVTSTSAVTLTTFASDDANVADVGIDATSVGSVDGHQVNATFLISIWEFTYTGTDLWIPIDAFNHDSPLTVSVDGTPTTPTIQQFDVMIAVPLLSGASNTAHTIKVTSSSRYFFDVSHTFYGNGTVSYPIGYGKIHDLWKFPAYIGLGQGMHRDQGNPELERTGFDSQFRFATTGGSGGATHSYKLALVGLVVPGGGTFQKFIGSLRLDPDGTLMFYMTKNGGRWLLTTDNVEGTPTADLTDDSTNGWQIIATGLDATAIDETATWTVRRRGVVCGNSITAAYYNAGGSNTTLEGDVHRLGVQYDVDVQNLGQPGTNAPTTCPTDPARGDTGPDFFLFNWGVNTPVDEDPSTTAATWTSLLTDTRTKWPTVPIYRRKILRWIGNETRVASLNATISDAIIAIGDANTFELPDTAGLVAADFADGTLHPNYQGYTKVMPLEAAVFAGTDTTPPTVTFSTTGTTLVMTPSEAITGVDYHDFAVTGGHTITGVSGSGAGPYTFTQTPPFAQGETATGSFTAANTVFDTADRPNAMATFSGKAISNTSTLTVPVAPGFTGDDVEPVSEGIELSPTAPGSDGGSAILSYQIWRKVGAGSYALLTTLLAADLAAGYLDETTRVGDDVVYKALCTNDQGDGPFSAAQEVTSQGPLPATPANLAVSADATGITVEWTQLGNAAFYDDLLYKLERSLDGTTWISRAFVADPASSYHDASTFDGVVYYYRVRSSSATYDDSPVSGEQHATAQGPLQAASGGSIELLFD